MLKANWPARVHPIDSYQVFMNVPQELTAQKVECAAMHSASFEHVMLQAGELMQGPMPVSIDTVRAVFSLKPMTREST